MLAKIVQKTPTTSRFLKRLRYLFLTAYFAYLGQAQAAEFLLPPDEINVVGEVYITQAKANETLLDIARDHGVGHNEITAANPDVDEWYPGEGTPVVIPNRYILPNTPHEGLVLNLPEMRIYYYPKPRKGERPKVVTFPVGIGRQDWQTPLGKTSISEKKKNPTWTPPASIKAEHAANGDPLPDVVPAGPDNPLGTRALRLAIPSYLIHGTNKPYGVGMRVSHGCVRMRQEDIEALFDLVSEGETVRIINEPLKIGYFAKQLFMEFHAPLEEENRSALDNLTQALTIAHKQLDFQKIGLADTMVETVVREASGLPVAIAKIPQPVFAP